MHQIILTDWQQHQVALSDLRRQVFIEEQSVPEADEWDSLDEKATHFLVLTTTHEPIGCARLLREYTAPAATQFHIGRVALLPTYRDQGIGHQLMRFILRYCHQQSPFTPVYLHAQTARQGFYERLGFIATGNPFMDAGIPHIRMELNPEAPSHD